MKECPEEYYKTATPNSDNQTMLLSRKEVANLLHVSLATLTNWMKRGLPFHKQRVRVYFILSEVMEHIKAQRLASYKPRRRLTEA